MELTKYSRNRFYDSMVHWHLRSRDTIDPVFNYLVYGFEPGSFFTSVFANDFMMAMQRSHPANSVEELKYLSGWIINSCPREAWGSYDKVRAWCRLDEKQRRQILEDCDLVFTEQKEIMLALQNIPAPEPMFF